MFTTKKKHGVSQYNRTTVLFVCLFVCVVRLYQKTRKFSTIALQFCVFM
ncbi:hypothetical protein HMPREF1577_00934 [Gardnerella pickettii JCP8017A]|uniref:Uncharacterized protein n=1 Tax=Gardnerella pickettii JCP8017A TaxID=1261062 RepID=T2PK99_9BIFI|nr:hypothetical protein HMPREF1577_00934 [Gardnerella pickettii JCP8017A]EPI60765.1 hypothetical protein HMPREF1578_01107 [Gardnerella pickettii JCP8017B]